MVADLDSAAANLDTWAKADYRGAKYYISAKEITFDNLKSLENLSKKFQFNLNFEGGEAETFVINCPIFEKQVKIIKSEKIWDGYRGRFEIVDAELENNA